MDSAVEINIPVLYALLMSNALNMLFMEAFKVKCISTELHSKRKIFRKKHYFPSLVANYLNFAQFVSFNELNLYYPMRSTNEAGSGVKGKIKFLFQTLEQSPDVLVIMYS